MGRRQLTAPIRPRYSSRSAAVDVKCRKEHAAAGTFNRDLVRQALAAIRPPMVLFFWDSMPDRAGVALVLAATAAVDPAFAATGEAFSHACFLETVVGNIDVSPCPNREIALSKAELSARTGRPTASLPPHCLRNGDVIFWGSGAPALRFTDLGGGRARGSRSQAPRRHAGSWSQPASSPQAAR